MSFLSVQNLHKTYKLKTLSFSSNNNIDAIKNISFNLDSGKTLAIVGESGSGKSTLARQIIGIENPTKGKIILNGEELNFKNREHRKNRFKDIRMIFQNPYESLNPKSRIGTILEEALLINTPLSTKQRKLKIEKTLTRVGLLPEHQYRYPHMFPGGQRQRIAIARAIILDPKLIIADEPLSALDVSIQAQILNLLQELQEELGISYLFISHDLNVVEHIADQVIVMFAGEIVEYGNIEQIFDRPLHPYTQALFASTPTYMNRFSHFKKTKLSKSKFQLENGCCFAQKCPYCEERCKQEHPDSTNENNGRKVACLKYQGLIEVE